MQIHFLYYEDCPSHDIALERLQQVMAEEGVDAEIEITRVETEAQAQALHFVGSPTILLDGEDIVSRAADAYYSLTCRVYRLDDGRISPLPSHDMIRRAFRNTVSKMEE